MRVPRHVVEARQARLAELIQTHGYIPISEICRLLSISEATVRRDLQSLSESRRVTRTHGGALADFNVRFPSFLERQSLNAEGKREIAARARALVTPGMTCYFDSGTTIHAVAVALREKPVRPLTAVTNNLHVAMVLADTDGVRVHVVGGQLLPRQAILLGDAAIQSLARWDFDIAFLGAEGLTHEGVWNTTAGMVKLQKTIARRSLLIAFCMDRQKIGRSAQEFLFQLPPEATLLTDASPSELRRARVAPPPATEPPQRTSRNA
jgi:DeoR/GlpR family transcriptional regulator of sugar metabolism